jgi:hypothetical protein
MEPKGRGWLVDLQNWTPALAWTDKLLRPAIIGAWHQETVPMHRGYDVEFILDRHLHFVAAAKANDRAKNRPCVA